MEQLFRYDEQGTARYALERDGAVYQLTGDDPFGARTAGDPIRGGLASLKLVAPVVPSKIVCVGLNYRDHAAEQNKPLPPEPLLFIKPSTAVIGPGAAIEAP